MGTRSVVACLALAMALAACSEQQEPESVAGPSLAGRPSSDQACDPNSLNSLISGYFPGNSGSAAKTAKDQMLAATTRDDTLNAGFVVLQEIGNLSRNQAVDTVAGSNLAQGIIKCMFVVSTFIPRFPTDAIYNFAPALSANKGGAFYTRGVGTGTETPVHGAVNIFPPENANILSGVNPSDGTWGQALAGSPAGKALIYGYRLSGYPEPNTTDPFVYEWATIPPATQFAGGALVALCDDANPSTAMVHESNIGVLAYASAAPICGVTYSLAIKDTGWGPRALAARLARVVDALQPQAVQAASTLGNFGTGGTASTFKSKFQKQSVPAGGITLTPVKVPPPLIKGVSPAQNEGTTFQVSYKVSASDKAVFGTCVFISGSNNNGAPTELTGPRDCPPPAGADPKSVLSVETKSANDPSFSQADFGLVGVTKTGGITFTVFADVTDRDGSSAVLTYKSNVKPAGK